MYAQRLLNRDLPTVRPDDPVGRVLELMDEFKVRQLPLVDGDRFLGLVYEDDLLESEDTTPMALLMGQPVMAQPHLHVYDVVSTMVTKSRVWAVTFATTSWRRRIARKTALSISNVR